METEKWKTDVKFITINGSRLYGINVDTSDYDFMGAVIEPPDFIIGLKKFEQHEWKYEDAKQEGVYYSLKKYVHLLKEGNPSVLCTMFSPYAMDDIGVTSPEFQQLIISAKAGPKFLGYMKSQMHRLETGSGMHVTRQDLINKFNYDSKYAGHIIRLGLQGIEYLKEGEITLPMCPDEREMVMLVRTGKISLQEFWTVAHDLEIELQTAIESCTLRPEPDHDAINEWLVETYRKFWN